MLPSATLDICSETMTTSNEILESMMVATWRMTLLQTMVTVGKGSMKPENHKLGCHKAAVALQRLITNNGNEIVAVIKDFGVNLLESFVCEESKPEKVKVECAESSDTLTDETLRLSNATYTSGETETSRPSSIKNPDSNVPAPLRQYSFFDTPRQSIPDLACNTSSSHEVSTDISDLKYQKTDVEEQHDLHASNVDMNATADASTPSDSHNCKNGAIHRDFKAEDNCITEDMSAMEQLDALAALLKAAIDEFRTTECDSSSGENRGSRFNGPEGEGTSIEETTVRYRVEDGMAVVCKNANDYEESVPNFQEETDIEDAYNLLAFPRDFPDGKSVPGLGDEMVADATSTLKMASSDIIFSAFDLNNEVNDRNDVPAEFRDPIFWRLPFRVVDFADVVGNESGVRCRGGSENGIGVGMEKKTGSDHEIREGFTMRGGEGDGLVDARAGTAESTTNEGSVVYENLSSIASADLRDSLNFGQVLDQFPTSAFTNDEYTSHGVVSEGAGRGVLQEGFDSVVETECFAHAGDHVVERIACIIEDVGKAGDVISNTSSPMIYSSFLDPSGTTRSHEAGVVNALDNCTKSLRMNMNVDAPWTDTYSELDAARLARTLKYRNDAVTAEMSRRRVLLVKPRKMWES